MNSSKGVSINFGYWPQKWTLNAAGVRVEPLQDFDEVVRGIETSGRTMGKWFYPPLVPIDRLRAGARVEGRTPVYDLSYTMPNTHSMHIDAGAASREYGEFVIALIGLLDGMRLIPEGWCHFYRAPVEPQTLNDLICRDKEIEQVLNIVASKWRTNHDDEVRRSMFGCIHWLVFSQAYEHLFERFAGQYIVLDSCFNLHCAMHNVDRSSISHARRALFLAKYYSIPVPSWATVKDKECELSRIRNEYIHEGRFGGEPIGFSFPREWPNITLELGAFCSRLILGILGVDSGYVRSPADTRQMHGLDLRK